MAVQSCPKVWKTIGNIKLLCRAAKPNFNDLTGKVMFNKGPFTLSGNKAQILFVFIGPLTLCRPGYKNVRTFISRPRYYEGDISVILEIYV